MITREKLDFLIYEGLVDVDADDPNESVLRTFPRSREL